MYLDLLLNLTIDSTPPLVFMKSSFSRFRTVLISVSIIDHCSKILYLSSSFGLVWSHNVGVTKFDYRAT
ncbi:Unknown protein, partial [Striga hermonthica]